VRRWNAAAGPLVVKVLLALNIAVFVLTNVSHDAENRLVLFGPAVADGDIYRIVTSGFVHFGIVHIGFNMALLYRLGESLESSLGRTRFALLYVAALLTGSLGALVLSPDAATGGASGAVFGLMGALAVGMHQRGHSVWEGGIGALIAINLVISFAVPGISIGGHLGGLAGGAAVGYVMLRAPSTKRGNAEGFAVGLVVAALAAFACAVVASSSA
jgi:membrane associated rhomboid family serine protease